MAHKEPIIEYNRITINEGSSKWNGVKVAESKKDYTVKTRSTTTIKKGKN